MASVSEHPCTYSALILPSEVMVTEDKISALALASVSIGSFTCHVGAGGPVPTAGAAPPESPAPSTTAAQSEEKKVETKKKEYEDPDDEMSFALFD
nr:60S acidic ribosomal protein P1-like [Odocoileus virginianus texanus]